MEHKELLQLCQWDFLSGKDAIKGSGGDADILPYKKGDKFCIARIWLNPFGLYTWLPEDNDDRAIVQEHKVKPKPWTTHQPRNPEEVEFICSTIESICKDNGLLAGVSCVGNHLADENFIVMFVKKDRDIPASFATFSVPEREMLRCSNKREQVQHLNRIADDIFHEVKRLHINHGLDDLFNKGNPGFSGV